MHGHCFILLSCYFSAPIVKIFYFRSKNYLKTFAQFWTKQKPLTSMTHPVLMTMIIEQWLVSISVSCCRFADILNMKWSFSFSLGPSVFTIATQALVQHFLIIVKSNECIVKLCLSSFDSKYEKNIIFMSLLISADFDGLLKHLTSMRQSKNRTVRTALAIFLTKMRLGLSNSVLTTLFHLKDKRIISHVISQVRESLKNDFVHKNLGFRHIDRQTALMQHQSSVATKLLTDKPNQIILVADATYLKCEKSSNNELQRATYSLHKHYHLVKPMVLTTTASLILFYMV